MICLSKKSPKPRLRRKAQMRLKHLENYIHICTGVKTLFLHFLLKSILKYKQKERLYPFINKVMSIE